MPLYPKIALPDTISDSKIILLDETTYGDEWIKGVAYAAYLLLKYKKSTKDVEIVVPITPTADTWEVPAVNDGHYEARLVVVPTYSHIVNNDLDTDTLSTSTLFYFEGELYKPTTTIDFKITPDPSIDPEKYTLYKPTRALLSNTSNAFSPTQARFVSEPVEFLWYPDLVKRYAAYVREAYKQFTGCTPDTMKEVMALRMVLLKVNTAESLKDYEGGQLIIESEERLIKACPC